MANYGTVEGANEYHAARGNAAWAAGDDHDKLPALVRGSQYIDGRYRYRYPGSMFYASVFSGEKTDGRAQELEWPRTGAYDFNNEDIPDDEVPREVEYATYEAALRELVEPGSLTPVFIPSGQVTKEKVGPVEIQYAGPEKTGSGWPPNYPVVPLIDGIIAPLLIADFVGPAVAVV